jgi:hypothetical protein
MYFIFDHSILQYRDTFRIFRQLKQRSQTQEPHGPHETENKVLRAALKMKKKFELMLKVLE